MVHSPDFAGIVVKDLGRKTGSPDDQIPGNRKGQFREKPGRVIHGRDFPERAGHVTPFFQAVLSQRLISHRDEALLNRLIA
jgi:hypothetical protein